MNTLHYLTITKLEISDRQRKFFDEGKIIDLAESIKETELIHAPAVLRGTYKLVAGERRVRAMALLHRRGDTFTYQGEPVPKDTIPVSLVASEDPITLKELELAENLLREDLKWQERVQAEKELHELRVAQRGELHTYGDTAAEIKGSAPAPQEVSRLKEDLFLAERLSDPEVAKIKDKKDALRVAKEKAMREKRAKMAETFKLNSGSHESPHTLIHGSMEDELPWLESFDLLLTDPPYGMDAGDFNSQFTIAHQYDDSGVTWRELMRALAFKSFAAAKDQAHAFVFCEITKWWELSSIFDDVGWEVWPRPLIWDKGSLGSLPKPNHGPRFCYEAIMFAAKGNKTILRTGRDVITQSTSSKTFHAAEKPVDLYRELIGRCLEPGGLVVDPFCGSGTIFPAATGMAVRAIGIEKEEVHYNTALARLRGEG